LPVVCDALVLSGPPRFSLDRIRRVVGEACRRVGARRAILFGSYARGTADAFSDLDLMIVMETEAPFVERFRPLREILDAFPGADLLVYTPAEFEDLRESRGFVAQAETEGVVLYDAGSSA
jgi:predicted nucleotidyltransferase